MKIFNALLFVFMSLMAVEQTAAATAETTAILPTVGPRAGILCPDGAIDIPLGTNIQTVVNAYPGATTFCIRAGVHSITSPVTPKTGNTFVGEYGAILDGTGWTTPLCGKTPHSRRTTRTSMT